MWYCFYRQRTHEIEEVMRSCAKLHVWVVRRDHRSYRVLGRPLCKVVRMKLKFQWRPPSRRGMLKLLLPLRHLPRTTQVWNGASQERSYVMKLTGILRWVGIHKPLGGQMILSWVLDARHGATEFCVCPCSLWSFLNVNSMSLYAEHINTFWCYSCSQFRLPELYKNQCTLTFQWCWNY